MTYLQKNLSEGEAEIEGRYMCTLFSKNLIVFGTSWIRNSRTVTILEKLIAYDTRNFICFVFNCLEESEIHKQDFLKRGQVAHSCYRILRCLLKFIYIT